MNIRLKCGPFNHLLKIINYCHGLMRLCAIDVLKDFHFSNFNQKIEVFSVFECKLVLLNLLKGPRFWLLYIC